MAKVSSTQAPATGIGPDEVVEGQLYFTAQGFPAYAVTKTMIALFGDPRACVLLLGASNGVREGVSSRFPFTRQPTGASLTLTQEDIDHA